MDYVKLLTAHSTTVVKEALEDFNHDLHFIPRKGYTSKLQSIYIMQPFGSWLVISKGKKQGR
jgi:hypothetical protein